MPTVMRNGDVVYQTPDGDRVTDRAAEVRTDTLSREAAFLALALASDRFPGQPLVVEGSPAFRAAVLEMSLHPIFQVTFADPALEKARRSVAHEEERKHPAPEPVRRPLIGSPAVGCPPVQWPGNWGCMRRCFVDG